LDEKISLSKKEELRNNQKELSRYKKQNLEYGGNLGGQLEKDFRTGKQRITKRFEENFKDDKRIIDNRIHLTGAISEKNRAAYRVFGQLKKKEQIKALTNRKMRLDKRVHKTV